MARRSPEMKAEMDAQAARMLAHNEAIAAYNRAQRALRDAQNVVSYLEAEVERTLAACQSYMPAKDRP